MTPFALLAAALLIACRPPSPVRSAPADTAASTATAAARWWKGNTHTHTLWSDGDDFPEMAAEWYKRSGYDFVAMTDHNTLTEDERWWPVPVQGAGRQAYHEYLARFGRSWVEERHGGDTLRVRLKRFSEWRPEVEEPGRFLIIRGEEITQYLGGRGAHVNALNVAELTGAQPGESLVEMFRRDLELLRAQEQRTGREIIGVLNHQNFLWSQTAEDLLALPELHFVEVYNGHPLVNVPGDSLHPGTERIWDIVLTGRMAQGGAMLYGVATDDVHDYHAYAPTQRNAGRGWTVVRASRLVADTLMAAMKRGEFYASTGVVLDDVRRVGSRIALTIRAEPGVMYTTQFVGTRRGYDTTSTPVTDTAGRALTRRYSRDVGAVLSEARGASPSYLMRGDELYVRARIISSKPKANPSYAGEVEMAWIQPVRP